MTGIMGQRSHAFHAEANGHTQDETGRDAAGLDAAVDLLEEWLGLSGALIEQCRLGEVRQRLLRQFGRCFQADAEVAGNATPGGQSSRSADNDVELF